MSEPAIFDACVHHQWADQAEIMQYMSRGWREYLGEPGSLPTGVGAIPVLPGLPYQRPDGDKLADAYPEQGAPGSSLALLAEQVLDRHGVGRAILNHDAGMLTPSTPNVQLAREIARAANDWTIERWLEQDARLGALILVPNQVPEHAVAEIERVGDHPGMAGVLMCANGLAKPFGHPAYHPIYAAAAERGLPIVVHAGGEQIAETLASPTAGGLPATYAEYWTFIPQAIMSHFVSMIGQGTFERFRDLRVLFSGGGVSWLASVLWRFDNEYRAFRREASWLRRDPSEYAHDHVRICTYPLETAADPERIVRMLACYPQLADMLVYGSGYPNWDAQTPDDLRPLIPAGWEDRLLRTNARALFPTEVPA